MVKNSLSCNIAVEGQVLDCPAKLVIGKQNKELVFCGAIQWGGRPIGDTIKEANQGMVNQVGNYVDGLLPECLPGELSILHQNQITVIGIQEQDMYFKLAMAPGNTAVLFAFQIKNSKSTNQDTSVLLQALKKIAGFFGMQELLFYAQTGNQCLLPMLKPGNNDIKLPKEMQRSKFLVYSHIDMTGDSIFVSAVRTLFGLHETELFLGIGKNEFSCMITIPAFDNSIMKSENLYIMMELGNKTAFILKGDFIFKFLPAVRFQTDCSIGTEGFEMEALAHMDKPVPLLGPFSIGDTCLMIGMSTGLTFGMYANLYIRNLQIFGALMLELEGGTPVPRLLAAAVSDLSIPILLDNLLGEHIEGIEVLDFIKILGLPFQDMAFDKNVIQQKDVSAIVQKFNTKVENASLRLDEAQVQLTPFGEGMELSDLSRMRHYYISKSGNLQLMAQFYYSTIDDMKFGNYTVSKGLFICGVIEIFGKRFEVLFSLNEEEGILAYAKIPKMDLGFLSISASSFSKKSDNTLPVAENSIMAQFLNPKQEGMVFYLAAGKKEISFYFDGKVELLKLFSVDARIIFCQGMISIDLQTVWLSILQISLHLKVEYEKFHSGNFEFCLIIDTSKLTEKLQAVTQKINEAIGKLRDKINNAKREIDRAQTHVDELYGQISNLNSKIDDCRRAISNASWWKKAFVAIAKGIEIGAYEVAKAGLYAAIGVATAALQVAKGVVNLGGIVGESVLKAVNAVIQGAMSLFYINYIKLIAEANSKEQYFQAEIDFVALGKSYHLSKKMEHVAIQSSPTAAISGGINEKLQPDLDHIEDGAFRSNWRKYQHENYTIKQHCKRLDSAKTHMKSSIQLMQSMQETYIEEFQTPMEEFDEMNVSLMDALGDVENVLSVGTQAGNVKELSQSMGGLKRSVAAKEKKGVFRDEELTKTKELIAQYDEARMFYDKVAGSLTEIQKHRQSMEEHFENIKETTAQTGEVVINGTNGDIGKVLGQVEEQMYESFPVDRSGSDFINLSREPLIQEYIIQAEERLGKTASEEIRHMRNRSRAGKYTSRL